ncbi:hypothetical protein EcWSU1_A008 (plasmid) [Enterobacter ludwigii]|uniref:Uncharacterized protein n=1 Tax=Enterobacter ludwigii TaxID=299767 RepID=G8LQ86_9ENTR|nr:hypothetical protein EcWSU1_A008 [Enterobacter ludwigii]
MMNLINFQFERLAFMPPMFLFDIQFINDECGKNIIIKIVYDLVGVIRVL